MMLNQLGKHISHFIGLGRQQLCQSRPSAFVINECRRLLYSVSFVSAHTVTHLLERLTINTTALALTDYFDSDTPTARMGNSRGDVG